MTGRPDFPHGMVDDYEPASAVFNLTQARAMLELLYGAGLETIPQAEVGACADCERAAILLAYTPRLHVCRRCALSRRRATARSRRAVAGSFWTGWRRVDQKRYVRHPDGSDHPPSQRRKAPGRTAAWPYWQKEQAA